MQPLAAVSIQQGEQDEPDHCASPCRPVEPPHLAGRGRRTCRARPSRPDAAGRLGRGHAKARRHAEMRVLGRPCRFRSAARPERHVACRDRAGLFDVDGARPGRQAVSGAGRELHGLGRRAAIHVQAALRRRVPQRRPVHRRRREILLRAAAGERFRLQLSLADREHQGGRRGRPDDGALHADQAHRAVPDLHGVPGQLDRAEEACRIRPRPEREADRHRAVQVRQLRAALGDRVRKER